MNCNKYDYIGIVPTIVNYDEKNVDRNASIHVRYMLTRTRRMFKWGNLVDSIPERNLELMLQQNGHVCIAEHNGELYAFTGSFGGVPNAYYLPTKYIVSNPYLNFSKEFTIGEDCVIIKNDTMYMGLLPLFSKYGSLLSKTELTMAMIVTLARAALVMDAEDESELRSAQDYIDKLERGELGIITRERLVNGETIQVQPGATSAAAVFTNLIELCQYWRATEFNEVGLNANWNAKRETITASEALLNSDTLLPLCDDMLACRKEACEEIEKMFGVSFTVDFDSSWEHNAKEIEITEEQMEAGLEVTEAQEDNPGGEEVEIDERKESE